MSASFTRFPPFSQTFLLLVLLPASGLRLSPKCHCCQICPLRRQHSAPGAGSSLALSLSFLLPVPGGGHAFSVGPPITISTKSTASPANAHRRLPPSTACEVCAASCTLRCARPLDKESFRATQAGSSPASIRAAPWPASANTATRELSVRKSTERRTNVHCGPQKREVPGGA